MLLSAQHPNTKPNVWPVVVVLVVVQLLAQWHHHHYWFGIGLYINRAIILTTYFPESKVGLGRGGSCSPVNIRTNYMFSLGSKFIQGDWIIQNGRSIINKMAPCMYTVYILKTLWEQEERTLEEDGGWGKGSFRAIHWITSFWTNLNK